MINFESEFCFHTFVVLQVKIRSSNIPQDKSDIIVKHVNEAMDKFTIEKVSNSYFEPATTIAQSLNCVF